MTQTQVAPPHGSATIPEAKQRRQATAPAQIDAALDDLQAHKQRWADCSIDERIALLESFRSGLIDCADAWIEAALLAKRIEPGSSVELEEWITGPVVLIRNVALLMRSLREIRDHGVPQPPKKAFARADGQVVVPVFPTDAYDGLLFQGLTAEIWMDPDVSLDALPDHQAAFYRNADPQGNVVVVLGAGNVASIGPMDCLYKMFVEGHVVILKLNPVNDYLGTFVEQAFAAAIDQGFLRVVYGGATEGEYLCQHARVDEIHITGSDKTHDAIVFGSGAEGARRKAANEPRQDKRVTSELGNVSPVIVVPGPWSASDINFHALGVASSLCNNAGFNCNAARVIIQHEQWSKRDDFVAAVGAAFDTAPARYAYYPGAKQSQAAFVALHPEAQLWGDADDDRLPWTLISGLDPEREDDVCFNTEPWCGLMSEVALGADSVADYIDRAVEFANERCWGTLSASILVHPKSQKDPAVKAALDRALANMRFGSVGINIWSALSYALVSPSWGAFPGHTANDIRSGTGVVHNTFLFDRPQKSIVRAQFRNWPRPAWFMNHGAGPKLGRGLAFFFGDPSPKRIPGLLKAALAG